MVPDGWLLHHSRLSVYSHASVGRIEYRSEIGSDPATNYYGWKHVVRNRSWPLPKFLDSRREGAIGTKRCMYGEEALHVELHKMGWCNSDIHDSSSALLFPAITTKESNPSAAVFQVICTLSNVSGENASPRWILFLIKNTHVIEPINNKLMLAMSFTVEASLAQSS